MVDVDSPFADELPRFSVLEPSHVWMGAAAMIMCLMYYHLPASSLFRFRLWWPSSPFCCWRLLCFAFGSLNPRFVLALHGL